jgi:hypothetical protein
MAEPGFWNDGGGPRGDRREQPPQGVDRAVGAPLHRGSTTWASWPSCWRWSPTRRSRRRSRARWRRSAPRWRSWSCATCSRGRTTTATRWSPSTPAPAAPSRRTGRRCCCACTSAGASATASRWSCSTGWRARRRGSSHATLEVRGQYAYGYLKAERGVHRLVRISPFDSQARRHTSFASVFVYPVVDDTIEIEIRDEDIEMDVYRASGPAASTSTRRAPRCGCGTSRVGDRGGLPAGALAAQEPRDGHEDAEGGALPARAGGAGAGEGEAGVTKTDIGFGSQIRSYVFQPYTMVNDHRTELKVPTSRR